MRISLPLFPRRSAMGSERLPRCLDHLEDLIGSAIPPSKSHHAEKLEDICKLPTVPDPELVLNDTGGSSDRRQPAIDSFDGFYSDPSPYQPLTLPYDSDRSLPRMIAIDEDGEIVSDDRLGPTDLPSLPASELVPGRSAMSSLTKLC